MEKNYTEIYCADDNYLNPRIGVTFFCLLGNAPRNVNYKGINNLSTYRNEKNATVRDKQSWCHKENNNDDIIYYEYV